MKQKNWLEYMLSAVEAVIFICIFVVVGTLLFAFGVAYNIWNTALHFKKTRRT